LVARNLVRRRDSDGSQQGQGQRLEMRDVVQWDDSRPERPLRPDAVTEVSPPSLEIREEELKFMEQLKDMLGHTPRSVKRCVNVYRLIKASVLGQSPNFVNDDAHADFKIVLFPLAVVTGLPSLSRRFFDELARRVVEPQESSRTVNTLRTRLEA